VKMPFVYDNIENEKDFECVFEPENSEDEIHSVSGSNGEGVRHKCV